MHFFEFGTGFCRIIVISVSVYQVRSGQIWGHSPEQRVAASALRRYCFGFRLTIAQADRRRARHAHILQIGLDLAIAQEDARPVMPLPFR